MSIVRHTFDVFLSLVLSILIRSQMLFNLKRPSIRYENVVIPSATSPLFGMETSVDVRSLGD